MRYLTLDQIRSHLHIDNSAHDYELELFGAAAEDAVENYLDRSLETLDGESPPESPLTIPAPVRVAMLMYVAEMFLNRETAVVGTIYTPTPTAERLLFPYRLHLSV